MLTLGNLINEYRELQLKPVADGVGLADIKVSGLVVLDAQDLTGPPRLTCPPGTLFLVCDLDFREIGSTARAMGRLIATLANHRPSGVVVAVPDRGPLPAFPSTTLAAAGALRLPLLTTTAQLAAWTHLNEHLARSRVEDAERQVDRLAGLMRRLPVQWSDPAALQRITEWLAAALDVQAVVREPQRGVLASATRVQPRDSTALPSHTQEGKSPLHRRRVSLAPTRDGDAVLEVTSERPFDPADSRLIQHAAHMLGLVDQAQTEFGTVHRSVRQAKVITYQLLTHGESDKAKNILKAIAPALAAADEARVLVIDCGSQQQREATLRHSMPTATRGSLVVPCPDQPHHIVIVEPVLKDGEGDESLTRELQHLVNSIRSHRMGGSRRRPLAALQAAHQEALTALQLSKYTGNAAVLTPSHSSVMDLLDPIPARTWACSLLQPLHVLPPGQREQLERTLAVALSHPRTTAARLLDVHRNTVAYRLHRAGELLRMDFDRIEQRVLIGLALELAAQPSATQVKHDDTPDTPTTEDLFQRPRVRAWADDLLTPLRVDRLDLEATLTTWLDRQGHVDKAAQALGIAEVTVRSHLKRVAQATGRDPSSPSGLRDLFVAVSIRSKTPFPSPLRPAVA
ncbi:helix-turn-helix domain-containing protein [Streptomyces sp. NPDC002835]